MTTTTTNETQRAMARRHIVQVVNNARREAAMRRSPRIAPRMLSQRHIIEAIRIGRRLQVVDESIVAMAETGMRTKGGVGR